MAILKKITKPLKRVVKAVVAKPLEQLGDMAKREVQWEEKMLGKALNAVTGVRDMRNAQRDADARAAEEADNPVIAPEQAVGGSLLDVDEQAQEDVTTRKRRRTQVSQSTSRGLTRRLGGHSMLN